MTTETFPSANQKRLRGLLPSMLVAARQRAQIPQKTVAYAAGLDPSFLCALERGRRQAPRLDVVNALCRSLKLTAAECDEFNWAMAHDRVLLAVESEGLAAHGSVVSAALRAAHYLKAGELAGLEQQIVRSIQSRQHLLSLEEEGQSKPSRKDETML